MGLSLRRITAGLAAAWALAACGSTASSQAPATPVSAGSAQAATAARSSFPDGDWRQFDYNAQRSGVGPARTGITRGNLGRLRRRTVQLPGTVDSSPVQLHAARVKGRVHDVVFVTTAYGHTVAFDPGTGRRLWEFSPSSTAGLQGTPQITNTSPIVDPNRKYVYAASPDGYVHKLRVSNGRQVWATRVTVRPSKEKLAGALNIDGRSLVVVIDGYDGDSPPYVGHALTLSLASGRVTHVFNALCSNRRGIIDPATCPAAYPFGGAAIWGRSGSVIVSGSGDILIATGNAEFNGSTNWGDSVLELSPTLRLLHNYTPSDQARLNHDDADLGSTEPALVPLGHGHYYGVQGGKDALLKLLDISRLDGTTGPAGPRTGGELQELPTPGNAMTLTEPAVWSHGGHVYVFVSDVNGSAGYELGGSRRLFGVWSDGTPGTSPVVAGGLLYVYNPSGGSLVIRDPASGHVLRTLPVASGHWNSPIVVGGRIIVPEGDYHSHATSGTIDVYHLPGR